MLTYKRTTIAWGLSATVALTAVLAGCSKDGGGTAASGSPAATAGTASSASAAPAKTEKPVEVTWYLAGEPQKDQAAIEAAVNKITEPAIGVTLKMNVFDFGTYDQKMSLKIASNEPFDLMFTSFSWLNKYLTNVSKGAFLPLDDLLAKNAPKFYASLPKKYWDATRVNGKIYGAPNYQIMVNWKGFMVQKSLADKYHFDYQHVTSIKQLEDFMDQVNKNENGITPLGLSKVFGHAFLMDFGKNPSDYTDTLNGAVVRLGDPAHKLMTFQDDNEYRKRFTDLVNLMHGWYQKGYIRKDAASVADATADIKAGKYAMWPSTIKPGGNAELSAAYGFEVVMAPTTEPVATTQSALATLTAVSRTSAHPDKAVQLLELVNTNKELYNLLSFGIKDKDYKQAADGTIEKLPDAGYWSNISWEFGNQFNGLYMKGQKPGLWE
ncbi:sugar ABC transporter substrate-binding protein [Paenibacillus cymbidii]|uniref:sugar ABC transporter substrate-binding protein n=1 Tax=Paenibacillus cymbidii TaxID=1639034 RepID=UPI001080B9BA|nr:sugar ABC transporter substrate-binding protein [Paenibacillus cymbidii]